MDGRLPKAIKAVRRRTRVARSLTRIGITETNHKSKPESGATGGDDNEISRRLQKQ
jgi:hypothetical protein